MPKPKAALVAEDQINELTMLSYAGNLYVQPAPDAEPVAVFNTQDVLEAIGAEQANGLAKIAANVAARGYTVRRFGGHREFVAAQAIKAAEEALELAGLVLPPGETASRVKGMRFTFKALFDLLANGSQLDLPDFDPAALCKERADVLVTLAAPAEADGQDLIADAVAKSAADVGRGVAGGQA